MLAVFKPMADLAAPSPPSMLKINDCPASAS
jgi:hypothetical protein